MAARSLLDGIESESGSALLQAVRFHTSPPGHTFFAPLDATLEAYSPYVQQLSTLNRGDVVEVQGSAGSGKTQLLQFIAMTAILPHVWEAALSVRGSSRPPRVEQIVIGGRQKCVVVVDCDGRFSVERTHQLVKSHLSRRVHEHAATIPALYSAEATQEDVQAETTTALKRLHVFRPTSTTSLAATLLELPLYMEKHCKEELAFILIDDISAFYWQDRFQFEKEPAHARTKLKQQMLPMRNALLALNKLRKSFGPVTFISNWGFPWSGDRMPDDNAPFYRQHLNRPYPSPFPVLAEGATPLPAPIKDVAYPMQAVGSTFEVTHQLALHAPQTKPIPKDMSFETALRVEAFRVMEQQELGSKCYVRMPGVQGGDRIGEWDLVVRSGAVDGL